MVLLDLKEFWYNLKWLCMLEYKVIWTLAMLKVAYKFSPKLSNSRQHKANNFLYVYTVYNMNLQYFYV